VTGMVASLSNYTQYEHIWGLRNPASLDRLFRLAVWT